MKKRFGPFRLTGGTHTEDWPTRTVRIKSIDAGRVEVEEKGEDGRPIDVMVSREGAKLIVEGKTCSMYIGDRKVTLGALQGRAKGPDGQTVPDSGTEVTLAEERIYGPPDLPENLRLKGVIYEPFMSSIPLDQRFNRRGSVKYEIDRVSEDRSELERLRQEVKELRGKLDDKRQGLPDGKKPQQPQGQQQSQAAQRQEPLNKPAERQVTTGADKR